MAPTRPDDSNGEDAPTAADDGRDAPTAADNGDDAAADDDAVADDDAGPVVALDASALMAPVEVGVRLFDELDRLLTVYETVVPAAVVAELDRLQTGAGKEATAASVGRDLAGRARTVETDASYADDALVELARAGRVDYVVTNDGPLSDRVLAADVPVIGLRGRNALAITEP